MSAMNAEEPNRDEEHVVVFRLGGEFYAIDIQVVQEIVLMQAITPIPGADPWVKGVTNLRGRIVAVLDLRTRCGMEASEFTTETRIVVARSARGMVGLIVDAVTEVLRIPQSQIEEPEAILGVAAEGHVRAVGKLEDRLVSLVNLEMLVPQSIAPEGEAAEAA